MYYITTIELLQKNPSKRMNIKEALEHPWLKLHENIDMAAYSKGGSMKKQMSDFQKYTHVINDSDLSEDFNLGNSTLSKAKTEASLKVNKVEH